LQADPAAKPASNRVAWTTVGVLTVANSFAFLDRQVLSTLVDPIKEDLGFNDTQVAVLMGFAFALLFGVMGLPLGRWVDSGSRRAIAALGIALWSLATAACGLARSFGAFFTARVTVGIGEAALAPAAYSMIADLFPVHLRGRAVGVYTLGPATGSGVLLVAAGAIYAFYERNGSPDFPVLGVLPEWQATFITIGLPGLLVAAAMMLVPEPRRVDASGPTSIPLGEVVAHMRTNARVLVPFMLGFGLLTIKSYGISFWIMTFLQRSHELSVAESTAIYGPIVTVCSFFGVLLGGTVSDWLLKKGVQDSRVVVALGGNLLAMIPIVTYPLVENTTLCVVLIAAYYSLASFTTPMGPTALADITPPRMRGQLSAIFLFMVSIIGLGLGPVSVSVLTDYVFRDPNDLRYSLSIVPLFTMALALVCLQLVRKHYHTMAENH